MWLIKRTNFINLEHGDMSVMEYNRKFISSLAFASGMYFFEGSKESMFEGYFNPKYKGTARVHLLRKL